MDYSLHRRQVGQRIVTLRKKQGLSQKQLALMTGINTSYLSEVENGISNISLNKLLTIADALGEPIEAFFTGVNELRQLPFGDRTKSDHSSDTSSEGTDIGDDLLPSGL